MWKKILTLLAITAAAIGDDQGPRKLYRYRGDEHFSAISAFSDPFDGVEYRLPNHTKPVLYSIELETAIHEGNFDFSGHVEIEIDVIEATDVITLHSRQLTISKVELWDEDLRVTSAFHNYTIREDREFLEIHLSVTLAPGEKYYIVIDYNGTLRDDDAGFYRSSYLNKDGEEIWLATTQFESTDARHAFPW